MTRKRKEWSYENWTLYFDGEPIVHLDSVLIMKHTGVVASITPDQLDRLAARIVRLLNLAPRRAP